MNTLQKLTIGFTTLAAVGLAGCDKFVESRKQFEEKKMQAKTSIKIEPIIENNRLVDQIPSGYSKVTFENGDVCKVLKSYRQLAMDCP